jgi:hypothetical protein
VFVSAGAEATLSRIALEEIQGVGIAAMSEGTITATDVSIRGSIDTTYDVYTAGAVAYPGSTPDLSRSLSDGGEHTTGILYQTATGTTTDAVIRGGDAPEGSGHGAFVIDTTATLVRVRFEDVRELGVQVTTSDLTLADVSIAGVRARARDGTMVFSRYVNSWRYWRGRPTQSAWQNTTSRSACLRSACRSAMPSSCSPLSFARAASRSYSENASGAVRSKTKAKQLRIKNELSQCCFTFIGVEPPLSSYHSHALRAGGCDRSGRTVHPPREACALPFSSDLLAASPAERQVISAPACRPTTP